MLRAYGLILNLEGLRTICGVEKRACRNYVCLLLIVDRKNNHSAHGGR